MNKLILVTVLAIGLAACGDKEGEKTSVGDTFTDTTPPTDTTTPPTNSGGGTDYCFSGAEAYDCDDLYDSETGVGITDSTTSSWTDTTTVPTAPPDLALVYANDAEPNNEISAAGIINLPGRQSAEQKIGFSVNAYINEAGDIADFYAITLQQAARIEARLCAKGAICDAVDPDTFLDTNIASVRIFDQFGDEIRSSLDNQDGLNALQIWMDAGLVYYIAVVSEDLSGTDSFYSMKVFESSDQSEPPPDFSVNAVLPNAPEFLSAEVLEPGNKVQLNWLPPTANVDGTPLFNLTGFVIYFAGDQYGTYNVLARIKDPTQTSVVLGMSGCLSLNLAITAVTEDGLESLLSDPKKIYLSGTVDNPC